MTDAQTSVVLNLIKIVQYVKSSTLAQSDQKK